MAAPLVVACAAGGPQPPAGSFSALRSSDPAATSQQAARQADLFTPTEGPVALENAATMPPMSGSRAVIYVPECASPRAGPDHIAYLQSLGHVVVVPQFGGDRCVAPTDRLGTTHQEIDRVVAELEAFDWIAADRLYLVGHGVGADVASTYTKRDVFAGMIGLAAACPFGMQNNTPMLTFRALDDAVLSNRGTRCTMFQNENAFHIEFAGSDHMMWLHSPAAESGARRLMRNAIARFLDADDAQATLAEGGLDSSTGPAPLAAAETGDATPATAIEEPVWGPGPLPIDAPAVPEAAPGAAAPATEVAPTAAAAAPPPGGVGLSAWNAPPIAIDRPAVPAAVPDATEPAIEPTDPTPADGPVPNPPAQTPPPLADPAENGVVVIPDVSQDPGVF